MFVHITKHVWPISPDLVIQNGCSHRRIGAIVHPHLMVILNYFILQICAMRSFGNPLAGHWMASFSIPGNHIFTKFGIYIWTPPPPTWTPMPKCRYGLMPIPYHVNNLQNSWFDSEPWETNHLSLSHSFPQMIFTHNELDLWTALSMCG